MNNIIVFSFRKTTLRFVSEFHVKHFFQVNKSVKQSQKRYLLGQFWVLQSLVIVLEPGQLPPLASFIVFDRDRDWVPPPQVFEQEE